MTNHAYSGVAYTKDYIHYFECSNLKSALSLNTFKVLNGVVVSSFVNNIPVEDIGFKVDVDTSDIH